MDFEQTEQEQIEQLRKWWKENWLALAGGLVIGLGGILGWDQYQLWQKQRSVGASETYEAVRAQVDAGRAGEAANLARQLATEQPASPYAAHARFVLAMAAAEAADWKQAADHLQWVIDNPKQAELHNIARLRLARVRWAAGDGEAALALLADPEESYAALHAVLRGDIERSMGRLEKARSAYQEALDDGGDSVDRAELQRKLDDLPRSS